MILLNKVSSNNKRVKKSMNLLVCGTVLAQAVPAFFNISPKAVTCISGASQSVTSSYSLTGMVIAYGAVLGTGVISMLLASSEDN